jgi:hypothetical protein
MSTTFASEGLRIQRLPIILLFWVRGDFLREFEKMRNIMKYLSSVALKMDFQYFSDFLMN